jgi:hypothetical protein
MNNYHKIFKNWLYDNSIKFKISSIGDFEISNFNDYVLCKLRWA